MADTADMKKTEDTPKAVSRRKFIQGVIAGGAGVSSATYLFRASSLASAAGAGERLITLNVNGQQRRVDVMKQETLAMTLRYKLGLTGTKIGCDRAECGACTVLIDDVPRYSCSTLTHTVRNAKVVTIEGLQAADGKLHPCSRASLMNRGSNVRSVCRGSLWLPWDTSRPNRIPRAPSWRTAFQATYAGARTMTRS